MKALRGVLAVPLWVTALAAGVVIVAVAGALLLLCGAVMWFAQRVAG